MSAPETRFAVLLFTDIVGSTELKLRHGVPAYSEALLTHNGHFERLARDCRNITILQNMGDGYFAEAGGIAEAVRLALLFQEAMREGPWREVRLTTRVGIHAGELSTVDSTGGSGIVAPAADLAARVMSLAVGGQILLTRSSFDEARHFIREHPDVKGKTMPPLSWLAHGPYQVKSREEPIEIYEVGAEGLAPLIAPPDGEIAKRAIRPGEEETLGWRPAIGLEIPGRNGWHLTGLLGAGGFGEVWAGEHEKLRQSRAFKFCFDDERLRALKREVTLVRLLQNALGRRDDIVHIHELKLDTPPFYLESDLAPQGNLLQWAEKQGGLARIPLELRIALVAHTATALAAAHGIGVLHKDIKPTNILIFDGPNAEPRPRLVDFGIGTLADPSVLGLHGVTAAGFTRPTIQYSTGTPTYSPPEYLAGRPYTIQGDIYGLGVLLYQLVTAKPHDPLAPGWERDIADPLLREDIAACVDGDPARRLPSAADLAERLLHLEERRAEIEKKRHLEREVAARAEAEASAIAARARATRFRKLATAFAMLSALAACGALLAWKNQRSARLALAVVQQRNIEIQQKNAEHRSLLVEAARSDRRIADRMLEDGNAPEAFAHLARACAYDPDSSFSAEQAASALYNTWNHLLPSSIIFEDSGYVREAEFSPDSSWLATVSEDGSARIWDPLTGKCLSKFAAHDQPLTTINFSPLGKLVVMASTNGTAVIWDIPGSQRVATLDGHTDSVVTARFSPDGTKVVTASNDFTARVWDATNGNCIRILEGHASRLSGAWFSPEGDRILTTSHDGSGKVWNAISGSCLATFSHQSQERNGVPEDAAFSRDGRRVLTAGQDQSCLWDAGSGRLIATFQANGAGFSQAGTIVTASVDGMARTWRESDGVHVDTPVRHVAPLNQAAFNGDGTLLITVSDDRSARVWDPQTHEMVAVMGGHGGPVYKLIFSPDGKWVATIESVNKTRRIWNLQSARKRDSNLIAMQDTKVLDVQLSADGKRLVTVAEGGNANVWDVSDGKRLLSFPRQESELTSARFSPDAMRVVAASEDDRVRIWDASNGSQLAVLTGHEGLVYSASFSPDGTQILSASADRSLQIWDSSTGTQLNRFAGHDNNVIGASFSPDGARILSCSDDKSVRLWDVSSGRELNQFDEIDLRINSAEFSSNGKFIVSTAGPLARIFDSGLQSCLITLSGSESDLNFARFSADGTRIVTTCHDETLRLWDSTTGDLAATLKPPNAAPALFSTATFSPDGSRIFSSFRKGVRIWNLLPPDAGPPPSWFPDFLRYMAQSQLNADGTLETLTPENWRELQDRLIKVRDEDSATGTPYFRLLRRYLPK